MSRRVAFACILLAAIIGGVIEWRQPMLPDSSWLLWVAGRWLDGATLYRDVFEVNPPLAIWLHAPVVWIARFAGTPVAAVFRLAVLLWCAGCVAVFDTVLRACGHAQLRIATIAAAAIVLVLPGPFFGQREHLLLAAALPWTALVACRMENREVPLLLAVVAGMLVAVAIALKPTHVGLWVALPLLAWRRRWWRYPETWIVPALGLGYVGLVAADTSYFAYLREWGPVYWQYRHLPFLKAAFGNELALLAVAACLAGVHFRRQPLTAAMLASTAGCLLGAALQAKGLPYHYWPADGMALLLLATAAPFTRYALVPVAVVWMFGLAQFAWDAGSGMRRGLAQLEASLQGRRPLVLGRTDDAGWLLVSEAGLPWLSPHYCLWWLQLSRGRPVVPDLPHWAAQDSALRLSLLPSSPPEALLIESGALDVEGWLRRAPEWRRLLAEYEPMGSAAGYRVFYHVAR